MVDDAPGLKRSRPPNIDLTRAKQNTGPAIHVADADDDEASLLQLSDDDDDDFQDTLQLSDSDSSDSTSPSRGARSGSLLNITPTDEDDDISKDLAELQQLRQSVKTNLRLRPIRSRSNLPKIDLDIDAVISKLPYVPNGMPSKTNGEGFAGGPQSATSPQSTTSTYFTPIETPFTSLFSAIASKHRTTSASSPLPTNGLSPAPSSGGFPPASTPLSSAFNGKHRITPVSSPLPPLPADIARPIAPKTLYDRLLSSKRPLLIDTRALSIHQAFHLRHSIHIAIPSLILKRCRKPAGGLHSLDALRQFITTDYGKTQWDLLMAAGGPWDGNVVIYDDDMDVKDRDNLSATAWAIMPVISPLLTYGRIEYLEGGLSSAGHDPDLQTLIVTESEVEEEEASSLSSNSSSTPPANGGFQSRKGSGLSQLDTQTALRFKKLPEIEPASTTSSNPPSPVFPRSPLPMMPAVTSSRSGSSPQHHLTVDDSTPSPPPSSINFRRPNPPRRPSVPRLKGLDTRSAERLNPNLPKLSVRTKPTRSATLGPPSLSINIGPPQSPSHLQLMYSNHSPPVSARMHPTNNPLSPSHDAANYLTPYYTPPHTPGTPRQFPPSPSTARPDLDPPTTEEAFPVFTVSTILPNFLFLGPELTNPEHVQELRDLGVKRILNIAAECDDDQGLGLKEVFKYYKIPMRDTVEEENITKGVREACDFIDDARLHSAPTYVHCKAGKSRSVTAVMAYLIHANHWTLSQAYAFVLERRKGISPNIGFVSELMSFEEQELGGKSVGVQAPNSAASSAALSSASHSTLPSGAVSADPHAPSYGHSHTLATVQEAYTMASNGARRTGTHVRESLPPVGTDGIALGGPLSAGTIMERVLGDSGQEMEIKDANGRYRHARRAPVDETTLQPMRRVSKAGLESSAYA
ncbi:hypothetical protein BDN70DRAFT_895599 [Pholiota conissans]|uniref:protein-tyrosine-phosphatase n=1 Tax=Pholiota conissans TaxID=109636 RepID=A0A9P6CZN9_9AGAR|nr:hypothetical protein BDN70DRAFT_895599 [Pholiota conissans]